MQYPDPHQENRRPAWNAWTLGAGVVAAALILWVVGQPLMLLSGLRNKPAPRAESVHLPVDGKEKGLDALRATDLLIEAVIQIETRGDPRQVGSAGERGLMQIREGTWREVTDKHFGKPVSFDRAFEPELNRHVGRLYLGDLQVFLYRNREHWRSDLRSLLLASYNAGPERVRESGFNLRKLPGSVQSYASRGSALHDWYLENDAEAMHKLLRAVGPDGGSESSSPSKVVR